MTQPTLLSTTELSIGYNNICVASNVTLTLAGGDVLAVVGHNGSGKSTLIKTLLRALPPIKGELNWPNGRPEPIAYLGQRTDFDSQFPIRVSDLAAMGAWPKLGFFHKIDDECRTRISAALHRTGTSEIANMPLNKLSEGQLQRTLFARTMVQNAPLILLDEPFTAIDQDTETELLSLIGDWATEGRAVILVLHDLSAVLKYCNLALLLGDGQALFGNPREILAPRNLIRHKYLSKSRVDWMHDMYAQGGGKIV